MTDGRRRLAGRYRLDGSLGRGGMSEVFHGYDERLDRRVAIKLLRAPSASVPAGPDSPEAVEVLDALERDRKRFLREIRTTAQLEHPGTPAVYDTGVESAPDGSTQLWLVMQLLRGSTLEAMLDRTDYTAAPPSLAWASAIAAQIAAVLADVHRADIVHRDIKPANVMLVDGGLVKVLDFGIAILRGAGAMPRLTQVDRTVGTPAYMSPEQGLGQVVTAAPTSTRSAACSASCSPGIRPSTGRQTSRCGPGTSNHRHRRCGSGGPTFLPTSTHWSPRCWRRNHTRGRRLRRSTTHSCRCHPIRTNRRGMTTATRHGRSAGRCFPCRRGSGNRDSAVRSPKPRQCSCRPTSRRCSTTTSRLRRSDSSRTASNAPATTPSSSCGCATSWRPRCSTPGSTRARRRCSTPLPPVPGAV